MQSDISQYMKESLAFFSRGKKKKKSLFFFLINAFVFWVHDNAKMQACQIQSRVWNEQMSYIAFSEVCTHLKSSAV